MNKYLFITRTLLSTKWDPNECSLYCTLKMFSIGLKMTVYGRNIMWPECIYIITVLIYNCVLTEYNALYKFITTQRDGLCQTQVYFNCVLRVCYMFRSFLRPLSGTSIQKPSRGRYNEIKCKGSLIYRNHFLTCQNTECKIL